jgi:hypothetical protein
MSYFSSFLGLSHLNGCSDKRFQEPAPSVRQQQHVHQQQAHGNDELINGQTMKVKAGGVGKSIVCGKKHFILLTVTSWHHARIHQHH